MEDSNQVGASSYIAPLSARERELVIGWERARTVRVSRRELVDRWGPSVASDITRALVRKGVLRRISPGVFIVIPTREQGSPTVGASAVESALLLEGEPYYLGGLWALSRHGLTEQVFGSRIDAFVARRRRPRRVGGARLEFHVISENSIMAGTHGVVLERVPVNVSTPERTLLDLLDYPDLAGRLRVGVRLVSGALDKVDSSALIRLAVDWSRPSTCQRLGVLLERSAGKVRGIRELRAHVAESRSLVSLLPGLQRTGRVNRRWNVVENDR